MIRRAATQDLTIILTLVDDAYQHWIARTGRVPGPVRDDYVQRLADAQLWVLEVDGEIVGELGHACRAEQRSTTCAARHELVLLAVAVYLTLRDS